MNAEITCKEETHNIIDNNRVPGEGPILLAAVVRVIDGGVVHHRGDHQVDVDPQGVVEHKADKGQETENIAYWEPTGTCETFHIVEFLTVDNILTSRNYSI